jgi:hypothetical protein
MMKLLVELPCLSLTRYGAMVALWEPAACRDAQGVVQKSVFLSFILF